MEVSIDPLVAWGGRLTRRVARTLAVSIAAWTVLASVPAAVTAWDQASAENTLWQLLNGTRVNNGLAPLQGHATLAGLARWRSQDMVDRGYFSHEVLGTGCRVYCWYDSNGLTYAFGGENIGWNSGWNDADSPVAVHEGFIASASHRALVLEPAFTHGGVGAYGVDGTTYQYGSPVDDIRMYTQLFMQAASAPSPPAPAPQPAEAAPAPAPPAEATPAPPAAEPAADPAAESEKAAEAAAESLAKTDAPEPVLPTARIPVDRVDAPEPARAGAKQSLVIDAKTAGPRASGGGGGARELKE